MNDSRNNAQRRGFALFLVLVLLAVMLLGLSLILQRLVARQRATQELARRLQAESLAEAGLDRALVKLAHDGKFFGETWQPTILGHSANTQPARVEIVVQPADDAGAAMVTVTAQFPAHPTRRAIVVRSRSLRIPAADSLNP